MLRTTRANNPVLLQVSATDMYTHKLAKPRRSGVLHLYDVHPLHEEGGVAIAGDTPLEAVIEM
jgi:hypothetical protein